MIVELNFKYEIGTLIVSKTDPNLIGYVEDLKYKTSDYSIKWFGKSSGPPLKYIHYSALESDRHFYHYPVVE